MRTLLGRGVLNQRPEFTYPLGLYNCDGATTMTKGSFGSNPNCKAVLG